MAYIGKTPSQATRSRFYYTATGGETSLSGADDNSNTLVFSDGNFVDVMLNGVTLVAGTDYNTATANTIGGLTALTADDVVEIVAYDTFSVFGGDVKGDFTITNGQLSVTDITANDSNGIQFNTDEGTQRAVIDDSGNLLVGRTSEITFSSNTTDGMELEGSGSIKASATVAPLTLQRRDSDGNIANFYKDGSVVGSIGNIGADLYIAEASNVGLVFNTGGNDNVKPCDASGSDRDNAINLGSSGSRFKDLYLSGGVYLGGTVAANYLDDYEEGTWTPTLPNGGSISEVVDARYVKIGKYVYAYAYVNNFASIPNNNTQFRIGGLPFNAVSGGHYGGGSVSYSESANISAWGDPLVDSGDNYIYFHVLNGSSTDVRNSTALVLNGLALIFTVTYMTA